MTARTDDPMDALRDLPKPPGQQSAFGTAGDFAAPTGTRVDPRRPTGYYLDLRSKADVPGHPPPWWPRTPHAPRVVILQWALGCFEHYLEAGNEEWLRTARWAADQMVAQQHQSGSERGGWTHEYRHRHTYRIDPPWMSGMAQGQAASLLVRIHLETGEDEYAEAALAAVEPMRRPVPSGGVAGELDGGWLPEEYPTEPASHVLNGAIFGVWGVYDVGAALGDESAAELAREGVNTIADSLHRYDTGYWSRYDLFPHPIFNIASPMYHRLHVNQLRAMEAISDDPRFAATAERFAGYERSRFGLARAYAHKVAFRMLVPRNRWLAHRLPWRHREPR
ncbi:MAG: D-glucuronyl C5-epimerase family protein [Solirubrobacterales bacterium]|nr:hypothetical protein [Solirubrobacterales bacterium]